jgi:hypothetical protein
LSGFSSIGSLIGLLGVEGWVRISLLKLTALVLVGSQNGRVVRILRHLKGLIEDGIGWSKGIIMGVWGIGVWI